MDQNLSNLKVEVVDDFLPYNVFKHISDYVTGTEFMWYFNKRINNCYSWDDLSFYFTHMLYMDNKVNSKELDVFKPLFETLKIKKLIRAKLNLYTKTDNLEKHKEHIDFTYPHKNCVYSFNTCNGFTILNKDNQVASIENRAIIFDGLIPHQSTSCTDQHARINININYL
jgi:hypothetical protein